MPIGDHVRDVSGTIEFIRANSLTFSRRPGKLEAVGALARRVEEAGVPGLFVEAGVAMGGSAAVIAAAKAPDRPLRLYDVFEVSPPPGAEDDEKSHLDHASLLAGEVSEPAERSYLDHAGDLQEWVRTTLRRAGFDADSDSITFVKGPFADTLHVSEPVAFAHVDCDWYDSVAVCIERLADLVSPGGIVLFDDYGTYGGCRKAVDQWLARDQRFTVVHHERTLGVERSA